MARTNRFHNNEDASRRTRREKKVSAKRDRKIDIQEILEQENNINKEIEDESWVVVRNLWGCRQIGKVGSLRNCCGNSRCGFDSLHPYHFFGS